MKDFSQHLFRAVVPSILLVLLTGGIVLDVLISERLEEDFDELMIAKALGLIALAEDGDDGVEMENYKVTLPSYTQQDNGEYFQLIADNGKVLIESASLSYWKDSEHPLPRLDDRETQAFLSITLPDGRPGRLMRKRFVPRLDYDKDGGIGYALELDAQFLDFPANDTDTLIETVPSLAEPGAPPMTLERQALTLQLAMSREKLDSLLYQVHSVLIVTSLSIMVLIVILARRRINNAVRPLQAMTHELLDIDEYRFDQRLSANASVSELSNLTQSINMLLERVESAFERERRFSGDVAHELRTPLTELRTLLDVADRWPEDPAIRDNFSEDIRNVTDRMQRTVETLLKLSRSEQDSDLLIPCPDLRELMRNVTASMEEAARQRPVSLHIQEPAEVINCLGMDQWQSIIRNLVENAVEYAPMDSEVDINLQRLDDRRFRFSVSNDAQCLSESDIGQMFQRLWRKDPSRTSGLHSGLGLALVNACCKQLDAQVLTSLEAGRLTISISASVLAASLNPVVGEESTAYPSADDSSELPPELLAMK